jgi:hypothetical protein
MKKNPDHENAGRVIALAIAFFGGFALLGYASGVFARLGTELTAMLGLFAIAFAILTYHLDSGVRTFVKRLLSPRAPRRKPGRAAPV